MGLKPFKGNTQGPVGEFLRQVYLWSLGIADELTADINAAIAAALIPVELDIDDIQDDVADLQSDVADLVSDVADHETRISDLESVETAARTATIHAMLQNISQAGERWIMPWEDSGGLNAGTQQTFLLMGAPGSVVGLYVKYNGGSVGAAGRTSNFYLEKNGANQAMVVTMPADESPFTVHSTTSNAFTFVAGDILALKYINDSGATAIAGPQDVTVTAVLRYS